MAHLPQFAGFTVSEDDDVIGLKRYDKICAIATNGYLPAKKSISSERLNGIKH